MAAPRRIPFHWSFLVVAALIPLIELLLPGHAHIGDLLRPIFIMAMLGLGLNILTGFTGQLNLGVAAFMAVGAYSYAILTCDIYPFRLGFWSATTLTVLVGLTVGLFLGLPTIRLRGDYLAIVTLGFGEIVEEHPEEPRLHHQGHARHQSPARAVMVRLPLSRGDLPTLVLPLSWLSRGAGTSQPQPPTLACRSCLDFLREDALASSCMGVNPMKMKLLAFALGAAQCSLAGALWASYLGSSGEPGITIFKFRSSPCAS